MCDFFYYILFLICRVHEIVRDPVLEASFPSVMLITPPNTIPIVCLKFYFCFLYSLIWFVCDHILHSFKVPAFGIMFLGGIKVLCCLLFVYRPGSRCPAVLKIASVMQRTRNVYVHRPGRCVKWFFFLPGEEVWCIWKPRLNIIRTVIQLCYPGCTLDVLRDG
jgi:hypothetical protein